VVEKAVKNNQKPIDVFYTEYNSVYKYLMNISSGEW